MNLSDINNVSDLLKQNEEAKSPFEQAVDALCECNYSDSRKVALWLLVNMLDFHKERASGCATGEEEGNPLMWAHDAGKLELIVEALKGIE